tara:strand:- start:996 stop:2495 length:1500 start_codon:yes stop_codon:yes gene_type:complete
MSLVDALHSAYLHIVQSSGAATSSNNGGRRNSTQSRDNMLANSAELSTLVDALSSMKKYNRRAYLAQQERTEITPKINEIINNAYNLLLKTLYVYLNIKKEEFKKRKNALHNSSLVIKQQLWESEATFKQKLYRAVQATFISTLQMIMKQKEYKNEVKKAYQKANIQKKRVHALLTQIEKVKTSAGAQADRDSIDALQVLTSFKGDLGSAIQSDRSFKADILHIWEFDKHFCSILITAVYMNVITGVSERLHEELINHERELRMHSNHVHTDISISLIRVMSKIKDISGNHQLMNKPFPQAMANNSQNAFNMLSLFNRNTLGIRRGLNMPNANGEIIIGKRLMGLRLALKSMDRKSNKYYGNQSYSSINGHKYAAFDIVNGLIVRKSNAPVRGNGGRGGGNNNNNNNNNGRGGRGGDPRGGGGPRGPGGSGNNNRGGGSSGKKNDNKKKLEAAKRIQKKYRSQKPKGPTKSIVKKKGATKSIVNKNVLMNKIPLLKVLK